MSTVLTKPVLLDETGQAIVGKLQDIQQAIGGTGEFIPINIRVTTPPTKTNYLAGETLDLSGMVVTLVANNGGMYDVTGDCVFSPADGSIVTSSTTEVNISYTWYKDSTVFTAVQPIGIKELVSIAVTTPPTVTDYAVGDTLELAGIVITATFDDGATSVVTSDCVFSPVEGAVLSSSDEEVTISYTLGGVTKTTTQSIVVASVYGIEWDRTASPLFTRTDAAANLTDPVPYNSSSTNPSSPFDTIYPWSGMEVVNDPDAGKLVKIPKYYYKITDELGSFKIQIADKPLDGYLVSPAHIDRGDGQGERDVVYVGAYTCATSTYKSTSGVQPAASITISQARTAIHNLGSDIWQWDCAMYWTILFLYLVEYARWDMKNAIGLGCGNGSTIVNNGQTDSIQYHTGYTSSKSVGAYMKYRHIENMWANVYNFLEGLYYRDPSYYVIQNPEDFNEETGGTEIGGGGFSNINVQDYLAPTNNNYRYALIPVIKSGITYDEYVCTSMKSSTGSVICVGNKYSDRATTGPSAFYWNKVSSSRADTIYGCRLMKLPANT